MHYSDDVFVGVEMITQIDNKYLFATGCWATPESDPIEAQLSINNQIQNEG